MPAGKLNPGPWLRQFAFVRDMSTHGTDPSRGRLHARALFRLIALYCRTLSGRFRFLHYAGYDL